ncbi:hypothetical protein V6R97_08310 [Chromohalobacter salexigens]|uniref:hypothetical protein n=1 Tax=Chromohalobacter israelensis TaxID=141390 RepID=UPI0032E8FE72
MSSLDIDQDRINGAFEKQKSLPNAKTVEENDCEIINEEYIKQRYHVDFDREVKIAIDYACRNLTADHIK